MTKEDIIKMAREADLVTWGFESLAWEPVASMEAIERFAQLVAADAIAKEREACAKVCEEGIANADDWNSAHWDQACENRAWAIRARGQACTN